MGVKIEERDNGLVFVVSEQKRNSSKNSSGIIQVSQEALSALEYIKFQTGLPITRVATELILYGAKHYHIENTP